jgi:uncharacterized repeat protein (TIGR01451 family)
MKHSYIVGIGALFVLSAIPFVNQMPGLANLEFERVASRNNQNKPRIALNLSSDKKVVQADRTVWQSLPSNATVKPGDFVRYNLVGKNQGNSAAKKLVVTQPIPQGTVYVLNSATDRDPKVTFSIDGGKTFVANPTIEVQLANGQVETRPAPAERYAYIRWDFDRAIAPQATVAASYEVEVR